MKSLWFPISRCSVLALSAALVGHCYCSNSSIAHQVDKKFTWDDVRKEFAKNEFEVSSSSMSEVQMFAGNPVVYCNGFKTVELDTLKLTPLNIPSATDIYSICDGGNDRHYALCSVKDGIVVREYANNSWSELRVPEDVAAKPSVWRVVADEHDVALLSETGCYFHNDQSWKKVSEGVPLRLSSFAMAHGKIYVGYNHGEWGGGLVEINPADGSKITRFKSSLHPVTDVAIAPDGRVWFSSGLEHMNSSTAALFSLDGETIECHSEVVGFGRSTACRLAAKFQNRKIGHTSRRASMLSRSRETVPL